MSDTPMTRAELTEWLRMRGVKEADLGQWLDQYAGKTEDAMDKIYDDMHG